MEPIRPAPLCGGSSSRGEGERRQTLGLENFPTLMKDMIVNILQTQQTPNETNAETDVKIHYNETV